MLLRVQDKYRDKQLQAILLPFLFTNVTGSNPNNSPSSTFSFFQRKPLHRFHLCLTLLTYVLVLSVGDFVLVESLEATDASVCVCFCAVWLCLILMDII